MAIISHASRKRDPGEAKDALDSLLALFSIVTLASTVPQVVNVWSGEASGVSAVTWLAYLVSACLWLVYGWRKRDPSIYLPCVGWILLDAAIVAGVLMRG